ncbi:MAG: hypothetical protein WC736_14025 [Gallionella sp.]|jgi:hypothetical protein
MKKTMPQKNRVGNNISEAAMKSIGSQIALAWYKWLLLVELFVPFEH